jgi:hypothetical protein
MQRRSSHHHEAGVEVELRREALYRTPRGKLCRWLPSEAHAPHRDVAQFVYVLDEHQRNFRWNEGFSLARPNWVLLEEVHGAAAW